MSRARPGICGCDFEGREIDAVELQTGGEPVRASCLQRQFAVASGVEVLVFFELDAEASGQFVHPREFRIAGIVVEEDEGAAVVDPGGERADFGVVSFIGFRGLFGSILVDARRAQRARSIWTAGRLAWAGQLRK